MLLSKEGLTMQGCHSSVMYMSEGHLNLIYEDNVNIKSCMHKEMNHPLVRSFNEADYDSMAGHTLLLVSPTLSYSQ